MIKRLPYWETHKLVDDVLFKVCGTCNQWFEMNETNFYKNKSSSEGFLHHCKVCTSRKTSAYNREHRDEKIKYYRNYNQFKRDREKEKSRLRKRYLRDQEIMKTRLKLWQQSDKGRERLRSYQLGRNQTRKHNITVSEWQSCKNYFDHSCAYCGLSCAEHAAVHHQDLHKEHVIHNGRNDIKNCVPSCKSCNTEKWQFPLNFWYNDSNYKYSRERYFRVYTWLRFDCFKVVERKSE